MEVIKDYTRLFPKVLEKTYERSKRFRIVGDIMSSNVITTTINKTLNEAAKIMGEKHIGSLIVVKKGEPVGIITERDLLSGVFAAGYDPKSVKVGSFMSSPLISIEPSATIKEAAQMMMKKKGRLLVFDSGKLVGIITASDLVRCMPETQETAIKVDDYMTKKVITADEKMTVLSITKIMGEKRIGSVVITHDDEPTGIFTERDLLTNLLARERSLKIQVGKACSSPLIAISSGTTIHEAACIMTSRHIRRLPIADDCKLIGIITARDLVEAYSR